MIPLENIGSIIDIKNNVEWTSSKINKEVSLRVHELINQGVNHTDKIIIMHGNSPAFFFDLFAVWKLGACAICLNPSLVNYEIKKIYDFTKAKMVLINDDQANIPDIPKDCILNLISIKKKIYSENNDINKLNKIDDEALILFTSGTTSTPKGVVHTYRSILSRISLNQSFIPKAHLDVTLTTLPTHFGHGLIGNCLTPLFSGAKLIIPSHNDSKNLMNFGSLIDQYNISFVTSVPSMWKIVIKFAKPPKNNSLKRVHIGSEPLTVNLWNEIIKWTGTNEVLNMYGITETANWIAGVSAKDVEIKNGLIGKMWGGVVSVVNHNGQISTVGEGEILVSTPSVMNCYLNLPELTSEVFLNGWFKTGDYGTIDEKGQIFITGRLKNQINKAGIKIYPEDIDILLESNPFISEACSFGIEDEIAGEIVGVAIVFSKESNINMYELKAWCEKYFSAEKIPDKWFSLNEIPKTDRGKINRKLVAEVCLNKN